MTGSLQGFLEEPLGRGRVTLSGKPKVDRGAGGIHGTIQVPPVPALADVGFIDPPGAVGWFQFPQTSLVQFGCVALHPSVIPRRPDTTAKTADTNGPRKQ